VVDGMVDASNIVHSGKTVNKVVNLPAVMLRQTLLIRYNKSTQSKMDNPEKLAT